MSLHRNPQSNHNRLSRQKFARGVAHREYQKIVATSIYTTRRKSFAGKNVIGRQNSRGKVELAARAPPRSRILNHVDTADPAINNFHRSAVKSSPVGVRT